jgi:hypothetical protein
MEAGHDGARRLISRRGMLGMSLAFVAGVITGRVRPYRVHADDQPEDNCYWQTVSGPFCSGGRKLAYRCEYCCAGGVCEQVQSAWTDLGPC